MLNIRCETPADVEAIGQVNRQAFAQEGEARLVDALRDGGYARLSLLAEVRGKVVGHVLFSELPIRSCSGIVAALALAPLAVLPEFQRQGIGTRLIREGLDVCREQGHRIVLVLGHPHFYPRFGFSSELAKPLKSPFSGEGWMAVELVPGGLGGIAGEVQYPAPFFQLG